MGPSEIGEPEIGWTCHHIIVGPNDRLAIVAGLAKAGVDIRCQRQRRDGSVGSAERAPVIRLAAFIQHRFEHLAGVGFRALRRGHVLDVYPSQRMDEGQNVR
jgi:hypothetical protein